MPHLQRAVAIDPQFAMAQAHLGFFYWNMGQTDLAIGHTLKAYELRDRVSDLSTGEFLRHNHIRHTMRPKVDARPSELPQAGQSEEKIHARSVTLSSERLKVIAKLDLVEAEGNAATPVDYKHGAPREGKDGIEMWPADRVQIALQAIVLRENGYECAEAVVFYQKTRQRVRVPVDSALVAEAEEAVARAWDLATYGDIPPPLVDSPKCPGCSLNTICLPDETNRLTGIDLGGAAQLRRFDGSADAPVRKPPASEGIQTQIRQLMTPRDDGRPFVQLFTGHYTRRSCREAPP
jgi:CRISPR-associated protein Cas4